MHSGNGGRLYLRRQDALSASCGVIQGELPGFFYREVQYGGRQRKALRLRNTGHAQNSARLATYPNFSGLVGAIISHKLATLYELQTIYSYEDALDMYEVVCVNNYNEGQMLKQAQ